MMFADSAQVIQIGAWESILGVAAVLISAGIAWGALKNSVKNIDKDLGELTNDFKRLNSDFIAVKTLVEREAQDKYAVAHSPRQLTPLGRKVLDKSGIKDAIDSNKEALIKLMGEKKPATAYDAELCAIQTVKQFIEGNGELLNLIKTKTFALGEVLSTVFFVGGLYFRDIILPELGFSLDDIDGSDPAKRPRP